MRTRASARRTPANQFTIFWDRRLLAGESQTTCGMRPNLTPRFRVAQDTPHASAHRVLLGIPASGDFEWLSALALAREMSGHQRQAYRQRHAAHRSFKLVRRTPIQLAFLFSTRREPMEGALGPRRRNGLLWRIRIRLSCASHLQQVRTTPARDHARRLCSWPGAWPGLRANRL